MLIDRWDTAHICIAVDDLEAAMARYTDAYGLEWGPILTYSSEGLVLSPSETMPMAVVTPGLGEGVSLEGLREVWSVGGPTVGPEGLPIAALELAHAESFSPAHTIWGCPPGQEYVHHIAYWVDDLEAESRHLVERGFTVEFTTPPGDLLRGFGYLRSPGGLRIELEYRDRKATIAQWFATGELDASAVRASDPRLRGEADGAGG
jgi:catechol 2,3-dioxygenase-like lactoylglutathione lyase family enzyme